MNRILVLILLALASGAGGYLLYVALHGGHRAADDGLPPLPAPPQAAELVPDFALPDLAGEVRSSAEWHGKVRVVNFWATWCPPCVREIPLLMDIQREYAERGVQVIGIAIDDTEAVAAFAEKFRFNYPVLVGEDEALVVGHEFLAGFLGLPFTAFADREGQIVRVHSGEVHREEIEAILAELL